MRHLKAYPPDFQSHPGPDGEFSWYLRPSSDRTRQTIHPFTLVQTSLEKHLTDIQDGPITVDKLEKFVDFSINHLLPTLAFIKPDLVETVYRQLKELSILKITGQTHREIMNLLWGEAHGRPTKAQETVALFDHFMMQELLPRIQRLYGAE